MHAISLYFMFYNFCKIHKTIRVTPAIEAGITDHVWKISDIVNLIPNPEPKNAVIINRKFWTKVYIGV